MATICCGPGSMPADRSVTRRARSTRRTLEPTRPRVGLATAPRATRRPVPVKNRHQSGPLRSKTLAVGSGDARAIANRRRYVTYWQTNQWANRLHSPALGSRSVSSGSSLRSSGAIDTHGRSSPLGRRLYTCGHCSRSRVTVAAQTCAATSAATIGSAAGGETKSCLCLGIDQTPSAATAVDFRRAASCTTGLRAAYALGSRSGQEVRRGRPTRPTDRRRLDRPDGHDQHPTSPPRHHGRGCLNFLSEQPSAQTRPQILHEQQQMQRIGR